MVWRHLPDEPLIVAIIGTFFGLTEKIRVICNEFWKDEFHACRAGGFAGLDCDTRAGNDGAVRALSRPGNQLAKHLGQNSMASKSKEENARSFEGANWISPNNYLAHPIITISSSTRNFATKAKEEKMSFDVLQLHSRFFTIHTCPLALEVPPIAP
jgi:hypothetical protein